MVQTRQRTPNVADAITGHDDRSVASVILFRPRFEFEARRCRPRSSPRQGSGKATEAPFFAYACSDFSA